MPEKKSQKELRLGVVLYGGVSLAVYMNGVATELWYLLRASRARVDKPDEPADDPCVQRYVALLDALAAQPGGRDLRVVVDTIAGTSAGGVNGTVLAKAIVEGADAQVLNRVWIEDADIAKLKDEPPVKAPWYMMLGMGFAACAFGPLRRLKRRVEQLGVVSWLWVQDHAYAHLYGKAKGRTPLSGDYFTGMIAGTLADMGPGRGDRLLPRDNDFDLYLTATDLHGWPRHLPVSGEFHKAPLYERAHAHVSHFRVEPHVKDPRLDDFALTFATRATAGFPGAFAPLTYAATCRGFEARRAGSPVPTEAEFAGERLREHELFGFPCRLARMIDGGVLDNKPFSHVATAIEKKPAEREVYRCVVYVEPDPQANDELPPECEPELRDLPGGLYTLFRHEPIVEDLRRLAERNEKVKWIECIRSAGEEAAREAAARAGNEFTPQLAWPPSADRLAEWQLAVNGHAAAQPFSGYGGYVQLKARRAVADLAGQLCHAYRFPYASRQGYFVRQLLRVWFDRPPKAEDGHEEDGPSPLDAPRFDQPAGSEAAHFHLSARQRELLSAFDLRFRLRRLRYLVREANSLYGDDRGRREGLDRFKAALADAVHRMNEALGSTRTMLEAVTAGTGLDAAGIEREIAELGFDPKETMARHEVALSDVEARLKEHMTEIGEKLNESVIKAIGGLGEGERDKLVEAFVAFPFLDVMLFPLMDAAGIEDPVEVRVMRISPDDGKIFTGLPDGRPSLKSAPIGAFAGFLDREAREHDLLWGRLDGAERLVDLLVEASGAQMNNEIKLLRCRLLSQIVEEQTVNGDHLLPLLQQLKDVLIVERARL